MIFIDFSARKLLMIYIEISMCQWCCALNLTVLQYFLNLAIQRITWVDINKVGIQIFQRTSELDSLEVRLNNFYTVKRLL